MGATQTKEQRRACREKAQQWPHIFLHARARDNALYNKSKKKIPFTITPDDVVIPSHCPVLGIPLSFTNTSGLRQNPNAPSIDRHVPELGYVPGNVTVMSWKANSIKNQFTPGELRKVADYLNR